MNYLELRRVAMRNSLVQWIQSCIVERLELSPCGEVIALPIFRGCRHVIQPHGDDYYCREIGINDLVRVGDLLKTPHSRLWRRGK
jgi:hypothetical protein